jgi:hypothetical protein
MERALAIFVAENHPWADPRGSDVDNHAATGLPVLTQHLPAVRVMAPKSSWTFSPKKHGFLFFSRRRM